MDIVIIAPQGKGKSHRARVTIATHLGSKSYSQVFNMVHEVDEVNGRTWRDIAQELRDARPSAILFDGVFTSPADFFTAIQAVKHFRNTVGRDTLAVYCDLGHNVVFTDSYTPVDEANDLLRPTSIDEARADRIKLNPGVADAEQVERIREAFKEVNPVPGATKSAPEFGIVVFYRIDEETRTIHEVNRTRPMPYFDAVQYYAEVPNPASQLIEFTTREERVQAEAELERNVKDRAWLDELFKYI